MISFGFEDSFDGLGGAAFRGLTEITGRMETFLLAETEAGAEAKAGAGTRGTETEAAVALAIETFGIVGIVGIGAGTIGIAEPVGPGTETEAGVTLAVGTAGTAETT
jgi:hypothetical protein